MDGLPWLIEALLSPAAFPEHPSEITLRQTHASYLFFTPEFVYKIKKPVNFGFLDFTTLEKRHFYCSEEIRLNRRLAPGVYIGIIGVTIRQGAAFMGGDAEPVEYAIKMKRMSEDSIFEWKLNRGEATEEMVGRIAHAIAAFHSRAETNDYVSGFGSLDIIRQNTGENFSQTADAIGRTISLEFYNTIKVYTEEFIGSNEGLFAKRKAEGFIRDCHGDIHCEHISVEDGINIFDCIEFNERFRLSDVVADIAFLSMDLDYHNRKDLSLVLDRAYFSETGDKDGTLLLNFYKCYRAFVRGKVEGFKAFESEVETKDRENSFLKAVYHFYLSRLYATDGFKPMLLIVCGLSGTGKTTLAREIAARTGFVLLSSDFIRKELAGLRLDETRKEAYGEGIYRPEFTERTYDELVKRADALLKNNRSVILDATFSKRKQVQKAEALADKLEAPFRIVECTAQDSTVKENMDKRRAGGLSISDADWGVYLRQKASFEEITVPFLAVRAEEPLSERLRTVFKAIFG